MSEVAKHTAIVGESFKRRLVLSVVVVIAA